MVTIEITRPGIYRPGGMLPVGTRLQMEHEPIRWRGKYRVIGTGEGKRLKTADIAEDVAETAVKLDEVLKSPTIELRRRFEELTGTRPPPNIKHETLAARVAEAEHATNV